MMGRAAKVAGSAPSWLSRGDDYVSIKVVARPGSTRRGILRVEPRGLVIAVNAPAEKGRANAELSELLATVVRMPKSAVTIARGEIGRIKTVRIATKAPETIVSALSAAAARV